MTNTRALDTVDGVYVYKTLTPLTVKVHRWVGWLAMVSLGVSLADAPSKGSLTIQASQYDAMFVGVVPAKRYNHYTTLANLITAARADGVQVLVVRW